MPSSVHIDVRQMIDLALGTPELGIVNFNLLHSLLHIITKQLDILETKIELRGEDNDIIKNLVESSHRGPSVEITEFVIDSGKVSKKSSSFVSSQEKEYKKASNKPSTMNKMSKEELIESHIQSAPKASFDEDASSSEESINEYESIVESRESKPSKESVSSTLSDHSKQVDVLSKTKSSTILIVDRRESQSLDDANPSASSTRSRQDRDQKSTIVTKSKTQVEKPQRLSLVTASQHTMLEEKVTSLQDQFSLLVPDNKEIIAAVRSRSSTKSISDMWNILNVSSRLDATETGIAKLSSIVGDLAMEYEKVTDKIGISNTTIHSVEDISDAQQQPEASIESSHPSIIDMIDGLSNDFHTLKDDVKELSNLWTQAQNISEETKKAVDTSTEQKIHELTSQLFKLDTSINNQMNIFQDQITDAEKDMTNLWETLNRSKISDGQTVLSVEGIGFDEYQTKIRAFQDDLKIINHEVVKLIEEKSDRRQHINELYEEIDVLRKIKADKVDLNDALADKADCGVLNNKVSCGRFDAMVENLSMTIKDVFDKQDNQEVTWQESLKELQNEMTNKANNDQISSLKNVIDKKIKKLQEKLKVISDIKESAEAAGTKSKYLRNVNCISCDNEVIMSKFQNSPNFPLYKPMISHPPLNPYVAYDIGNIRQFQKCIPCQHDFNDWQFKQIKADYGKNYGRNGHLCNRYCGGSHTVTTAQQRVLRRGNFTNEWGPRVIPVYHADEEVMRVEDEKIYQNNDMAQLVVERPTMNEPKQSSIQKLPKASAVEIAKSISHEVISLNKQNSGQVLSTTKSFKKKSSNMISVRLSEHTDSKKSFHTTEQKSEIFEENQYATTVNPQSTLSPINSAHLDSDTPS